MSTWSENALWRLRGLISLITENVAQAATFEGLLRGEFDPYDERARDVVEYAWDGETPVLTEHSEIAIEDRGGRPGRSQTSTTSPGWKRGFSPGYPRGLQSTRVPPRR